MAERFAIAQVAPHPLEDANEVGTFATEVSRELAARGHKVLLLAPSRSPELVRESRKLIRAARENPEELFDPEGGVRVLGVGELLFNASRKGINPAPPVDIARTIEEVLTARAAGLRARARAVGAERGLRRAAPQPRAERGLLPRAGRARAEHPGRAQVRGVVLRADGRPHRVLRGDGGADEPLLPGLLPAAAPRGDARGAAGAPRRSGADRVQRPRGARGAAAVPARAETAPRGPAVGGGRLQQDGRGADAAVEPAPPRDRRLRRGRGVRGRGHRGRGEPRAGHGARRAREGVRRRGAAAGGARPGVRGGPARRRSRPALRASATWTCSPRSSSARSRTTSSARDPDHGRQRGPRGALVGAA